MTNESQQDNLASLVRGMKTVASPFRMFLNDLHRTHTPQSAGAVSSMIPELAKADPDWFGICVVDTSGQVYEIGSSKQTFTMQSIGSPFLYGLALMDHGREAVAARVSTEPTGDNAEAVLLDTCIRQLPNPISVTGAIATVDMIKGATPTDQLHHMIDMFQRYVGHELVVDAEMFTSMRTNGHWQRGLAHLMRNCGLLEENVDATLDLFFQQQSLLVTCRDLAVMAATLANGGTNPVTNETAVDAAYISDILNVMYTCGMQHFTGDWTCRVGMPAVTGISGGLIAVVPHHVGIAVFSPPLGTHGHSDRGVKVCEDLSRHFGLHMFDAQAGRTKLQEALAERSTSATRSRTARTLLPEEPGS